MKNRLLHKWQLLNYIGIIFILLFPFGCKNNYKRDENKIILNELIVKEGKYCGTDFCLEIFSKQAAIRYLIYDSGGRIVYSSNKEFNKFQRWGFLVDSNKTIWIYSSDIGLYYLIKGGNNNYSLLEFGEINRSNVQNIPVRIFEFLPSVIKKSIK